MSKLKKAAAVAATASAIAAGSSFVSMAAQAGWVNDGSGWAYLDARGEKVTDSWKKSGDYWYYLGADGDMVVDQWVDDTYYVDVNGVMIQNRWVYMDAGTDGAPNADGGWYYFGVNGKAVTDGWKTINQRKYHFDSDGTMQYGWLTDNGETYYLGDENDGAAAIGWRCLEFDKENLPQDGDVSAQETSGSDTAKWFYFQTSGKAVKATNGTYANKTINGSKYYFDENGAMLTGWASIEGEAKASASDATGISGFKYFGDENSGQMAKGWKYLTDSPMDSDDSSSIIEATASSAQTDDGGNWYYFENDGTPKFLAADAESMSDAVSRINGQNYFFDQYGRMRSGLLRIVLADGTERTAYFGSSDADGKMRTDRNTGVIEESGDRSTFYFEASGSEKGAGVTGEKKGYLYANGKLVAAEKGSTTQVFEVNGTYYLVNESGKIQTANKAYKSDGEYAFEYDHGTIYEIDADKNRLGVVSQSESLPEITYNEDYILQ